MVWINIPTPINMPITGKLSLIAFFDTVKKLIFLPQKAPTAALMIKISGIPSPKIFGSTLSMVIKNSAIRIGR